MSAILSIMLMVMAIAIPGIVIYFAFELYSTTHDDGSDNTDESPGKVAPSSHAPRSSHDSSVEYKPSNYIDYNEREESEREVRCFFGKPLETNEDWEKWWIIKYLADNINDHLDSLAMQMRLSASANELDAIHTEWLSYYNRYRQLCIECHLWNEQIDEKVPFMPSDTQIAKELALYRKFEQLYNDAKISLAARVQAPMRIDAEQELKFAAFRDMMDDIYAYLDAQRGHFAIRYMMLHDLSRDNKKSKDKYAKLCADMVSYGMLAESKNDSGYYVIKKISNRQSSADSEIHDGTKKFESTANSQIPENTLKCELPPSKYNKSFYASLSDSDGYRAKYTVGTPESLNKTTNNCEFTSTSCGIRYQTSLERCTCPAFSRNQAIPCKHMIALAAYLGYYKLPGQASDPVIKLDPIPSYDQNPSA